MSENENAEPSVDENDGKSGPRRALLIGAALTAAALIAWLGRHTNQHEWAVGWLRRYERFSPWSFCLLITLEGLAVSVALSIAHTRIRKAVKAPKKKARFEDKSSAELAFFTLLFAPVVETLLFQALIIGALKWLGLGMGTQVAASAFLFASIHFAESIAVGVAAGIPGGLYFGFTFAFWLQGSFWTAFWVTAVSHFLNNLFPVAILIWRKHRKKKANAEEKPPADAS